MHGAKPKERSENHEFHSQDIHFVCRDKQSKNRQAQADSSENSLIDVPGGIIYSDLKGLIQPVDRVGNRYMINFIDHHTNYCDIFLAMTKAQAAKYVEHF
jgi:hypothetical protein